MNPRRRQMQLVSNALNRRRTGENLTAEGLPSLEGSEATTVPLASTLSALVKATAQQSVLKWRLVRVLQLHRFEL